MAYYTETHICEFCQQPYEAHHPASRYCGVNHRTGAYQKRRRVKYKAMEARVAELEADD